MKNAKSVARWAFGVAAILSTFYAILLYNFWPNDGQLQYIAIHRLTYSIASGATFTILFFVMFLDFRTKRRKTLD